MADQSHDEKSVNPGRKPASAAPDEVIGSRHGKHGGSEESEGSPQEQRGSSTEPRQADDAHGDKGKA